MSDTDTDTDTDAPHRLARGVRALIEEQAGVDLPPLAAFRDQVDPEAVGGLGATED